MGGELEEGCCCCREEVGGEGGGEGGRGRGEKEDGFVEAAGEVEGRPGREVFFHLIFRDNAIFRSKDWTLVLNKRRKEAGRKGEGGKEGRKGEEGKEGRERGREETEG